MAVNPDIAGRPTRPPGSTRSAARRSPSSPPRSAAATRRTSTPRPPGRSATRRHRAAHVRDHRRPARRGRARAGPRGRASTTRRVVHGEQRFIHHRPIVAGDRLVATPARRLRPRGRRPRHGDDPRRDRHRGRRAGRTAVSTHRRPGRRVMSRPRRSTRCRSATSCPAATVPARPALDLVRYAGASGDFNPIHWNERIATSVGLPDVIAHGMLTMATAGRARHRLGRRPGRGRRVRRPVHQAGRRARRRRRRRRSRSPAWWPPRTTRRAPSRVDLTATSGGEQGARPRAGRRPPALTAVARRSRAAGAAPRRPSVSVEP